MDSLRTLLSKFREPTGGGSEKPLTAEQFTSRYNTLVNKLAIQYAKTDDPEETERMRKLPARERKRRIVNENGTVTPVEEIVPLIDQNEELRRISPRDLGTLLQTAMNDPEITQFLAKRLGTRSDQLGGFFNNFGVGLDIVHQIEQSPNESRWIRHATQKTTPDGVLYFPNTHLKLLGMNTTGPDVPPEDWLKALAETPMPGFAHTFYSQEPDNTRRITTDTIYRPDPKVNIIRYDSDPETPLFLVLRDLDSQTAKID